MQISKRQLLLGGAMCLAAPNVLRGGETTIELCCMLDQSSSMFETEVLGMNTVTDSEKHRVQRQGHIDGLRLPEVSEFLIWHQVRVRMFVWSTAAELVCEGVISSRLALEKLLSEFAQSSLPRNILYDGSTYHEHALMIFRNRPAPGIRRIIDVSTDEAPWGEKELACRQVRDLITGYGGKINVLAFDEYGTGFIVDSLVRNVQSPNGFTQVAASIAAYEKAIQDKFIGELF